MEQNNQKWVNVALTAETLGQMLASGRVCAADFRCLDCPPEDCLWQLGLKSRLAPTEGLSAGRAGDFQADAGRNPGKSKEACPLWPRRRISIKDRPRHHAAA